MIDRSVEPLVREVFNAVIVGDETRFENALSAISDDRADYALRLATAIDRTVIRDLHDGPPSDERVQSLTHQFIEMQKWSNPKDLPVENFLRSIAGLPAEPVPTDISGLLAFLVGGWLLAAFLNSGNQWYEYLDDILDRLDVDQGESWASDLK